MRMHKSVLYVLFPAFLCYYAAVAHASLQKDVLSGPESPFSQLRRIIPRLAVPACLADTVHRAMSELREAVEAAGLLRDSRPTAEQSRRDFVALWKDLEPSRPEAEAPVASDSGYPVLVPGQD
jgi:hypothetical protein